MTVRFAQETYAQLKAEPNALALADVHFAEVAPQGADLEIDHEQFQWMCEHGLLHVVTARNDGVLVGYHLTLVRKQLHRNVLSGYVDAFFLDPEHRKGSTGMRLMKYAEETLKRRGVKWLYTGTKHVKNIGILLEHMGHKAIETQYLKILGE